MRRRAFGIGSILVLLFSAVLLLSWQGCIIPPPDQAYAGSTKQQIVARLGPPTTQFSGHYGLVPTEWADAHPNCVTLEYKRLNGTLYVTLEPKHGQWVGLCSQWLPAGGQF